MTSTLPEETKSGLNSCPYCGSDDGLYLTIHQTYTQSFSWEGENLGASEGDGNSPRVARCLSCKRLVTKEAKCIKPFNRYNHASPLRHYDMGESIL